MDVIAARMRAQRLAGAPFDNAVEAVGWFGGVQAQDYPAAKWALGLRVKGATDAAIDRLYDEGAILRTHVLRPTWHFVLPRDVRWMIALTGPKILQSMAGRYRQLELDSGTIDRAHDAFARALAGGNHLTRPQLGDVLTRAGIAPDGQRLPHLIAAAELRGLIVSGPLQGKQISYALLEERVAKAPVLDRDQALRELTARYFISHGPARPQDLVRWSSLTLSDVRRGIEMAGDVLAHRDVDGVEYWFDASLGSPRLGAPAAHLLPNFDEYTVAYIDRSALHHPTRAFQPELFAFSSILSNVVIVSGRVVGGWRRLNAPDWVRVEVRSLDGPSDAERALIDRAGRRFSSFLQRPVVVVHPAR
jgi:winged helix DNA-binding protein